MLNNPLIFGRYILHSSSGDSLGKEDSYNKIYAFDREGKLLWSFEGNEGMKGFAVNPDFIAVGDRNGYLYALSWDGKLLWKFKTKDLISNISARDINGDGEVEVVVGSWDNYIYALSGKDGKLLWKFKTGSYVASSPALGDLDGDGYIDMAVGSLDGYLYVFEATARGGKVVWSTFSGDASRTGVYENALAFAMFNLSGKAFAWYPHRYSLHEFVKLGIFKYFSLQKVSYKPSSHPRINKIKKKKAINTAIKIAKVELKQKIAKEVKRIVKKLSQEAELTNVKIVKAIYNNILSEVFKEIDKLEPYQIIEPKEGEIHILIVADGVAKKIEDKTADLIAKALEGEEIKVVAKVDIPKLEVKPSKPSEITVTSITFGETLEEEKKPVKERNCVKPDPNYYFFGVVVYDYDDISNLSYVKNDKELIYKLATCYMGVPEENIKILENPAYAKLKRELRKFARSIKRKDATLYFYYSGHGILDSKGKFYILPADASIEDEETLEESGVNIEQLKRLLARAKGKKVAFIDACRIDPPWKPAVVVYKPKLTDQAFIFSTKKGQLSNVDKDKRYSAFTRALYEMASSGLINLDFDDDGYVEIRELIKPLTKWVRKVSADDQQTPDVWGPKDFEVFPVE